MAHLYASFVDAAAAEKAAGALLDYGVRQEDISLVAHDDYGKTRQTTPGADYALGGQYATTDYSTTREGGYGTSTAAGAVRGVSNVGDSALDAGASVGDRLAQAGDRVAGAVTGAVGATGTAAGYDIAADQRAGSAEGRAAMAGSESAIHGGPTGAHSVGVYSTPAVGTTGDLNPLDQGGPDSAINTTAAPVDPDATAKHGISTTTPEDAGEGAIKGTGIGLGVGILASLAALAVPGVGLVLGAGVLASALGATALAAGAGAIAGGVTGYLKDQGVPADMADHYHGTVAGGGAVLSLNVPSGSVDAVTAEQVLAKYGGSNVNSY